MEKKNKDKSMLKSPWLHALLWGAGAAGTSALASKVGKAPLHVLKRQAIQHGMIGAVPGYLSQKLNVMSEK
jgi:hypothetical protein